MVELWGLVHKVTQCIHMTNVHTEWHPAPLSTTARHTCWRPCLTDTASWVTVRMHNLKMQRWTIMNYGLVIGGQKVGAIHF